MVIPVSTAALVISITTRRSSSFAELDLGDDLLHHINGDWDWWTFKWWVIR